MKIDLENIDSLDPKKYIVIKGARVNNLKHLDVAIPRNTLTVITGLSGSGKSSLAFDTLFAEGQRMYVESLSSYARQFLGKMEKPEVDYIKGLSPGIAIEQKVNTRNPRSTVGTTTEIYDYLKLLFARIGTTYSPVSGKRVKRDSPDDIVQSIMEFGEGARVIISCPLVKNADRELNTELRVLLSKGYTRLLLDGKPTFIEDIVSTEDLKETEFEILLDRITIKSDDDDIQFRLYDSIQTAYFEGHGVCYVRVDGERREYSDKFEKDGITFEVPSVNFFSFNNPYGACRTCEGFGNVLGIDRDLVIPDKSLSVYEGAIAPWRGETMKKYLDELVSTAIEFDFPIHRPYHELSDEQKELLWTGNSYFKGLNRFFKFIESKLHKIQYRVMLSRYRGRTVCPDCRGTRLRKDTNYVKIADHSISDLTLMPVEKLSNFFNELEVSDFELKVANRILKEIRYRLHFLSEVGLEYLTLNRLTSTLSGGEYQRIKLGTSLGSALVGSMYVLDEPSIGLHPRDTHRLINVLKSLRDLGNTVVVVEHEEEVMRSSDYLIDIGPEAGSHGGELVFHGNVLDINGSADTYTTRFLSGALQVPVPTSRRGWNKSIKILGARENNLKGLNVDIPLGVLTVITGVSGSGKSTLVRRILFPSIGKVLGGVSDSTGKMDRIDGDYHKVTQVEFVDQNPIGKSSRSNPVTYVKAYDAIRQLFSDQQLSVQRGYKPAFFSFNVDGGRCESCQGEGVNKIEMQFMADIYLTCEECKGKRFKREILDVRIESDSEPDTTRDINEVLELTVEEALQFFKDHPPITKKLQPLFDVGLGYIKLGQSSNSLSGGEAQRVKLASFIGKDSSSSDHILFIFDEPTTGLHFQDIKKLLEAINRLVDKGNSVLIIEHNMEIIKCADWIIDLGPEGGEKGGEVVFEGTPEAMVKSGKGYTAKFLKEKL